MSKVELIDIVRAELSSMGIPHETGSSTDIIILADFLDAGWSTGKKKITYEASIFADEETKTVFMWEMTKEQGHGLSFGSESSSSFQSGKTLFRKVKSIQYGPDGKAYEYTLDLGAIPKAVKETAQQYGWKFKTVINKKKAMYPVGYMTTDEKKSIPLEKNNIPANKKLNKSNNIGFYLFALIIIGLFALMDVNLTGWLLCGIFLILLWFNKGRIKEKGCISKIFYWIIVLLLFFLILVFTFQTDNEQIVPSNDDKAAIGITITPPDGWELIENPDVLIYDFYDSNNRIVRAIISLVPIPAETFEATDVGVNAFFESIHWSATDYKINGSVEKLGIEEYKVIKSKTIYTADDKNSFIQYFVDLDGSMDVWIQLQSSEENVIEYAPLWENAIKTIETQY